MLTLKKVGSSAHLFRGKKLLPITTCWFQRIKGFKNGLLKSYTMYET